MSKENKTFNSKKSIKQVTRKLRWEFFINHLIVLWWGVVIVWRTSSVTMLTGSTTIHNCIFIFYLRLILIISSLLCGRRNFLGVSMFCMMLTLWLGPVLSLALTVNVVILTVDDYFSGWWRQDLTRYCNYLRLNKCAVFIYRWRFTNN